MLETDARGDGWETFGARVCVPVHLDVSVAVRREGAGWRARADTGGVPILVRAKTREEAVARARRAAAAVLSRFLSETERQEAG
jgi:hypothetical protein